MERRAASAGSGVNRLFSLHYGILWLPWVIYYGMRVGVPVVTAGALILLHRIKGRA